MTGRDPSGVVGELRCEADPLRMVADDLIRFGGAKAVEIVRDITAAQAVEAFREEASKHPAVIAGIQRGLRGKNLACWCRLDAPCHADVLLELANGPEQPPEPRRGESEPASGANPTCNPRLQVERP